MTDKIWTPDKPKTFEEMVKYFEEKQKSIEILQMQLNKELQTYKAEMKAFCGITDGEQMNVLEILKTIKKVQKID